MAISSRDDFDFKIPRVIVGEVSMAFYSLLVSELARYEQGGRSISTIIELIYAHMCAARTGTDLHRAIDVRSVMPEGYVAKESCAAFTLFALNHLIQGNYITSLVSANAAVVSCFMVRMTHGEKGFNELLTSLTNAPKQLYNKFIGLFSSSPAMQFEIAAPSETKKNR